MIEWNQFDEHFKKVDNGYFASAWEDALVQLKQNRQDDLSPIERKKVEFEWVRGLDDLLNRLHEFKQKGMKYVGFTGKIEQADLETLKERDHYKISYEQCAYSGKYSLPIPANTPLEFR